MEAYIINGYRSAVAKSKRGGFRFYRPDDLATDVIKHLVANTPGLEPKMVDDLIVGNAVPEAEQGMQMGRMISLLALGIDTPGFVMNRYCGSGLEAIALAVGKIKAGMADCIIAGGVESMSVMAMGGWRIVPNPKVGKENPTWYWGMGLTAEAVAEQFKVSREDQDAFALASHQKAKQAIDNGYFKKGILPIEINETYINEKNKRANRTYTIDTDEGVRADTTIEALAKLKPAFAVKGSVTAGNSSQTSDGSSFVMVMSEKLMNSLGLKPIGRLVNCASAGVHPRIMGIGPIAAVPKVLKQAGMTQDQIDLFELNEAFASQSLAVIRTLNLDINKVNINGGAIALGHPLGCTGSKLTVQILNDLERLNKKYGIVTACVGGGQGIAGIIERM